MSDSKLTASSRRSAEVGGDETQLYCSADAVVRILDDYLAALKAGQAPSRQQLLAQHPELASQLEACLAGLDFIHQAQATTYLQQKIGDFRIVREVGRGGMGAVYEAIQTSLGRRVALKILRFSPTSDHEAVERFQREAETVAALHHTNIVPIFFVGNENGVNYYAMQFIEGRDLAQVIAEAEAEIPPLQVAAWGLQAAEALAHAHRRGVIHRDVKPSNLILDKEDRLWLTDFGLARRLDDVTLSLTGMLLGTPRYMSPEHARASSKRIDHRSDIFSLGATLYELLTRSPAFPGDAAHDVIQHILADDPRPIRQLNPAVPRDLETVVMKCMAKEPSSRYASAEDLAADLRAVLEDRPIRARRASHLELARRWLKQNQRSVSQVSTAAMVTLAITLTTLLGWSSYTSWKMSGLRLAAANPPLVAEFLDARGNTVRTETLPMQVAANLPAGDYDIRVSAEGTLSQTFDVSIDRGRRDARYTVDVADQWLISPQPLERSYDVFDTGREQAIVIWNEQGLKVHQLHGPPSSWSLAISPQATSALNRFPGFTTPRLNSDVQEYALGEMNESRPWIVHELVDVNGDGVGDIICAARHQAWLMAISGTGEGVLWFAGRGRELTMTDAERAAANGNSLTQSSVLYPPLLSEDLDGDGVRDLIVSVANLDIDFRAPPSASPCDRSLEAISSRTGQSIWRYGLSAEHFALSPGEEVPYELRWFHRLSGGRMSQGGNTMWLGLYHLRAPPRLEQTGAHNYLPSAPHLLKFAGQSAVAVSAGKKLLLLDAESGELREEPLELSFRPGNSIRWADVDGDGLLDMVALEEIHSPASNQPAPKLVVWSVGKGKQLWSKPLDAYWPSKRGWSIAAPPWPLVTDLDNDGKCEIIVPDGRSHNSGSFTGGNASRQRPSGNLAVYDGTTGTCDWVRTIVTLDAEVDYFIDGPDLDGDGTREVFAATCDPKGEELYVDALSGATGQTLWTGSHRTGSDSTFDGFRITGVQAWQSGADGWPQLIVSLTDNRYYSQGVVNSTVLTFSMGTGKLTSTGGKIAEVLPVDLDRDAVEDLIVCSHESKSPNSRGSFHCIRGIARQPWKRLASLGEAMVDLDRDGFRDFVHSSGDGTLAATSGASGGELWRSRAVRSVHELGVYAYGSGPPQTTDSRPGQMPCDLNEDGYADLIVFEGVISGRRKSPLHAISGRNGKLLWSMDDVTVQSINGTVATKIIDLEQDGKPEVLWLAAVDYRYPQPTTIYSNSNVQLWLFVASGRTGKLRWAQPLSPAYGSSAGNASPPFHFSNVALDLATADMTGDGVVDIVAPAVKDDGSLEIRALDGTAGAVLWSRARLNDGLGQQSLENWTSPSICDLEGDGRPEVVLVEPCVAAPDAGAAKVEVGVTVLDAAGREVWKKATGSAFMHFSSYSRRKGEVLRPVVMEAVRSVAAGGASVESDHVSTQHRTSRIVVVLPGDPKILSFDVNGESVERKLSHNPDMSPVLAYDTDRDGEQELLFVDRGTIYATRGEDLEHALWQRPLGDLGQQQILAVLPRSDAFPPLVVARTDATTNSVLALDAENGEPVWTSSGPIARGFDGGSYYIQTSAVLLGGAAGQPPLVCFGNEFVNDCRQGCLTATHLAAATGALAANTSAEWAARGTSRLPAVVGGVADDPRWKRPLPWFATLGSDSRMYSFIAWSMFFSLTLLIIPASYGVWLVIKRRFQVVHLLLLPVVAAIFIQAVLITAAQDNDFSTFPARLSIALAFSPPMIALGLLVRWVLQKRWRRIGLWLSVLVVSSLAIAAVSIVMALQTAPLIENERFDWSGWYLILLPGAHVTSWIMMFVLPLEAIAKWFVRRRGSRARQLPQSQTSDLAVESGSIRRSAPSTVEQTVG